VDDVPTMAARLPELLRTVPLGERFVTRNGKAVVVTSLDLWTDRVALNFAYERDVPLGMPGTGGVPLWGLHDDVDTDYMPKGGGSGGSDGAWFGYCTYFPRVPTGAQRLSFPAPTCSIPIEVRLVP
jgi:hypothetical protein